MDYRLQSNKNKKDLPTILIASIGNIERHNQLKRVKLDNTNIPFLQENRIVIENTSTSIANIITNHLFLNPNASIKKIILTCNNQPSSTAKEGTCHFYEQAIKKTAKDIEETIKQLRALLPNLENTTQEYLKQVITNLLDLKNKINIYPQHLFLKINLETEYLHVDVKNLAYKLLDIVNLSIENLKLSNNINLIFDITHGLKWQSLALYIAMLTATNQSLLNTMLKQNKDNLNNKIAWQPFIYIQTAQKDTKIGFINHIDSLNKEFAIATANKFLYEQFNLDVVLQNFLSIFLTNSSIGKSKKIQIQQLFKELLTNWQLNLMFPFEEQSRQLISILKKFKGKEELLFLQVAEFTKLLESITPKYNPKKIKLANLEVFLKDLLTKRLKLIQYLLTHNSPAKGFLILKETLLDIKVFLFLKNNDKVLKEYLSCLVKYIINQEATKTHTDLTIKKIKQEIITNLIDKKLAMFLFQERYKASEFKHPKLENMTSEKIKKVLKQSISFREIIKIYPYDVKQEVSEKLISVLNDMKCTKTNDIIKQIQESLNRDETNRSLTEILRSIESKISDINNMNIRNSIAHIGYTDIYKIERNTLKQPDIDFVITHIAELIDIITTL